MLDQEFHISKLILRELNQTLTASEQAELQVWINTSRENAALFDQLKSTTTLQQKYNTFCSTEINPVLEKVQSSLNQTAIQEMPLSPKRIALKPVYFVAAAITALILASSILFWTLRSDPAKNHVYANDIDPGKNGATLTLSNGQKIKLSAQINGLLAEEAGVEIRKSSDGSITYEVKGTAEDTSMLNTLATARGEVYKLRLPDGSLIWLNAASSITYPASFKNATKRQVKLTGEAYFEIAKDKRHPFIVETNRQSVEVLGTHFNISSYDDNQAVKTTLLEGSVSVYNEFGSGILKSGEQSIVLGRKISVGPADVEQAMDWKNGKIVFNDESLLEIMKKISRWYNVDVTYRDGTEKLTYQGAVSRTKKISSVLNFFRDTETVDFIVQGNQITVIRKE